MISSGKIENFCNVNIERKELVFSFPKSKSLYELLKENDSAILEQVITAVINICRILNRYDLDINNVVLDYKKIYINKSMNKIFFIYLPIRRRAFYSKCSNFNNIFKLIKISFNSKRDKKADDFVFAEEKKDEEFQTELLSSNNFKNNEDDYQTELLNKERGKYV